MNDFELAIKLKELGTLKTKEAKASFIRALHLPRWYISSSETTLQHIKLILAVSKELTDTTISGVKSLPQKLAGNVTNYLKKELDITQLEELNELLPKQHFNHSNLYREVMDTNSVPAHVKIYILLHNKLIEEADNG